ncbi:hypothetical protein DPMN_191761 [Dreissena polymorpha]|uniref:Uncharacterized protein n=1 Tax=Dreissena polymorpha TaxID=45954 RepID=A0A9D3Y126_DREPO|nr:hypothetical protein DPMN_191761 [Dreissena polymorpha]
MRLLGFCQECLVECRMYGGGSERLAHHVHLQSSNQLRCAGDVRGNQGHVTW